MEKIDLVVTYVNSADPQWQVIYNQHRPSNANEQTNGKQRFRENKHFIYWFRGVANYAPWINNIFLIVQSKSQVPTWIDTTKVKIVLHEEFIPQEYLPVFNSQAIEMFLHKIPGLNEKFLYSNDDNYIIGDVKPEDFFDDDKVKTSFSCARYGSDDSMPLWKRAVINSGMLTNKAETEKLKKAGSYMSPMHGIRPYLKSKMEEAYSKYEFDILNSISKFRETKNFTVYLFDFYLRYIGLTREKEYKFSYFSSLSSVGLICTAIINPQLYKTICINDTAEEEDKKRIALITEHFESHLSSPSKYEVLN